MTGTGDSLNVTYRFKYSEKSEDTDKYDAISEVCIRDKDKYKSMLETCIDYYKSRMSYVSSVITLWVTVLFMFLLVVLQIFFTITSFPDIIVTIVRGVLGVLLLISFTLLNLVLWAPSLQKWIPKLRRFDFVTKYLIDPLLKLDSLYIAKIEPTEWDLVVKFNRKEKLIEDVTTSGNGKWESKETNNNHQATMNPHSQEM